jgi:hypothetical protein
MNNGESHLVVGVDETDLAAVRFVDHFVATVETAKRLRQFDGTSTGELQVWEGTISYGANKAATVAVTLLVGPADLLGKVDFRVRSSSWFEGRGFLLGRQALKRCKDLFLERAQVAKGRLLVLPAKSLSDSLLRCAANELAARLTRPDPVIHPPVSPLVPQKRRLARAGFAIVGAELPTLLPSAVQTDAHRELAGVAS